MGGTGQTRPAAKPPDNAPLRHGFRDRRRGIFEEFGGQILGRERPFPGEDDQTFQRIFQFANIAGPVVLGEGRQQ